MQAYHACAGAVLPPWLTQKSRCCHLCTETVHTCHIGIDARLAPQQHLIYIDIYSYIFRKSYINLYQYLYRIVWEEKVLVCL